VHVDLTIRKGNRISADIVVDTFEKYFRDEGLINNCPNMVSEGESVYPI
jgi:hypothetical protein